MTTPDLRTRDPDLEPGVPKGVDPETHQTVRAVEGRPPNRRFRRKQLKIIVPLLVVAWIVSAVVFYRLGGMPALLLSSGLFVVFCVLGGWVEMRAVMMRKEAEED